jgi:hypothetical protein
MNENDERGNSIKGVQTDSKLIVKQRPSFFTKPWLVASIILIIIMSITIIWSNNYRVIEPISTEHDLKRVLFLLLIILVVLAGPIIILVNRINGTKLTPWHVFPLAIIGAAIYGIVINSYTIANALLDSNPPAIYVVQVVHMQELRGTRNHTYIIQIKSDNLDDLYRFEATGKIFKELSVDDTLIISVKPGYFGNKWLYKYDNYKKDISNVSH